MQAVNAIYPRLHGGLLLIMRDKPADVGNHTDLFAGLADLCYPSYRCAPHKVGT